VEGQEGTCSRGVMAYDTEELYERALMEIDKNNLFFDADVIAFLGIAESTFYAHFPPGSKKSKHIKEKLNENRVRTKISMRSKWYESENPTLQMGLMKIISTDEEFKRLSNYNPDSNNDLSEYMKLLKNALQPLPEAKKGD